MDITEPHAYQHERNKKVRQSAMFSSLLTRPGVRRKSQCTRQRDAPGSSDESRNSGCLSPLGHLISDLVTPPDRVAIMCSAVQLGILEASRYSDGR
jgi:hypothetical protein